MFPENIIYIGVALNLVFTIWYIKTIFKDGTRPNPISWFVWTLAPFVGVFLQIKSGAGLSVLGTFMSGFGPFLVLVFSLLRKDAFWKINKFDVICGLTALFSIVLYIITNNLGISILFAILADLLAYIPTLVKTYRFPKTENASIFIGGIVTNTLALLIIKDWKLAIYAFSFYLVSANFLEVVLIYRKYFKKSKKYV